MDNSKSKIPKYHIIAYDIAKKIANEQLKVGDKVRGRSVLASQYNVSSETIRKSIALLNNMDVVEVKPSSGVYVKSKPRAIEYLKNNEHFFQSKKIYSNINKLLQENQQIHNELISQFTTLVNIVSKSQNYNFIEIFDIMIESHCSYIEKTIPFEDFWNKTGGTIVGVSRNDKIITSPGPNFVFNEKDVVYIAGDSNVREKTFLYLYKEYNIEN